MSGNDHLRPRDGLIRAGERAPDFTLPDQNRKDWTLSQALGSGDVVLCFFPLAFTGVCGTEMKCITEEMSRWAGKGAQVVGISCDSFAVLKAWADQMGLRQTLLADMHRRVCRAYGLYWADLNVSSRGTVVVTRDHAGEAVVAWSQSREPKNAMNFDEVLAHLA